MRDERIEAWLDGHGITWDHTEALDLALVDRKASRTNQARDEAVNTKVVEGYAFDMESGAEFPPIVVRKRKRSNKVVAIGGNHRIAACDSIGATTHAAYIIDCADEMALRLAIEDNRLHGLPPSTEEKVSHGIHLIALGMTQEDAARVVGVSAGLLSRERSAIEATARAGSLGVVGFETLTPSTRYELAKIDADAPFAAAAQLAIDRNLKGADIVDLVRRVRAAKRSEAQALSVVSDMAEAADAEEQARANGKKGRKANPRTVLMRSLGDIDALDVTGLTASCATADQRKATKARIKATARHLMALDKAL